MTISLFRTTGGPVAVRGQDRCSPDRDWDDLFNEADLYGWLENCLEQSTGATGSEDTVRAPIGRQEVWAAGVTYYRSRVARMEESRQSGGGDFYDRVYDAERPEIFFKATASRVVGDGEAMCLRADSAWIVPEPELVLAINRAGTIFGYTIGNDLSCRDIEGENPLYLPQAKTFDRCAALGPGIAVTREPLSSDTRIQLAIERGTGTVFTGDTSLADLKRSFDELVGFLFRDNSHPDGCFLMTGTGIVPPDSVTLARGDVVRISIDGLGTLSNRME
jgi:2-dehydro-3-deoxy-D-arabinonate dehydratase